MRTTSWRSGQYKVCTKCKQELLETDFYIRHRRGRSELTSSCKECNLLSHKTWAEKNKAYLQQYYLNHIDQFRASDKKSKFKNRESLNTKQRLSMLVPEKRQKSRDSTNEWRRNHLAYDAMRQRERRAIKLQAFPIWADREKIQSIYEGCPKGYHVDHIVPLKGKNVSGLHVEFNLQYLPALENIRKRNSYAND